MSTVCVCVCLQNLSSEIKCWTKNFSVVFFASCFLSSSRNVFWLPFEDSVQHEQQREREREGLVKFSFPSSTLPSGKGTWASAWGQLKRNTLLIWSGFAPRQQQQRYEMLQIMNESRLRGTHKNRSSNNWQINVATCNRVLRFFVPINFKRD